MILLFISSEENMGQLEHYRTISEKLSRARVSNDEAEQLSQDGKAIVWIDGGMHSTELAHGQMTSELAYKIATEESDEMKNIRDNVITLLMPVMNPDGLDIVTNWYRKNLDTSFENKSTVAVSPLRRSRQFYEPDSMPEKIGAGIPTDGTDIFYPDPWEGGESHFRDAVDYMLTGSMAVLDMGAERKSQFLYNIYSKGRDGIEEGDAGDPYAYIIPPEQWDRGEAIELVNILKQGGVEIHRAENAFTAGDKEYEAGSYVVKAGQPFRPFVLDMMEPQDYPTLLEYPGGPPDPPYDLAGWTLPMQMGVEVDRIDTEFDFSGSQITEQVEPEPGNISGNASYGYVLSHKPNASANAANQLVTDNRYIGRIERTIRPFPMGLLPFWAKE